MDLPSPAQAHAETGTAVNLDLGSDGRWHLVRPDHGCELEDRLNGSPAGAIATDMDTGRRQLTGAPISPGAVATSGPAPGAQPLLDVRGIIV